MPADVRSAFYQALESCETKTEPFRYWELDQVFPREVCDEIAALPFAPPVLDDNEGKRETYNAERNFFSAENRARFAICAEIADILQSPETVRRIETRCGVDLAGSYLRIEHCQDKGSFWLEPHTDIGAKLFTLQIYLNDDAEGKTLGTDIYDNDKQWVRTMPAGMGRGYILVPGRNTYHGFRKRTIEGLRKSIIINYVKDEWRARRELAFPDSPVAH
jgi:hypothetical protein